jgi:hypothetical protein
MWIPCEVIFFEHIYVYKNVALFMHHLWERKAGKHVPSFSKAPIDIHTPSGLKPLATARIN